MAQRRDADGTTLLRDIVDGPDGSFPGFLATAGSQLFFAADDGASGDELWTSDGTSDGTQRVRDIEPGPEASSPAEIATPSATRVFFTAADSAHGNELWVSDGTEEGTTLVRDIVPGPDGSFPFWLTAFDDRLAFTAERPRRRRGAVEQRRDARPERCRSSTWCRDPWAPCRRF